METNEDLDKIKPICLTVIKNASDDILNQFFYAIDDIPIILANSPDSFLNKLIKLNEIGVFTALSLIFDNNIKSAYQIKLLKFWDFLISTASSSDELNIIFSNNLIHKLILCSFDLTSIEILQSYITVLKEISLKAKNIDPKNLFTQSSLIKNSENSYEANECPLYSHSVNYINNADSVVSGAARFIVLNLCLIKYPPLQAYLSESSMLGPFDQLINNIGPDEFAFIVDFLNVAPLNLREYIIHKIRLKFSKCPLPLLCRGAMFLKDSPARSMLIDTLSERIFTFSVSLPLTLGILLFSLENNLILLSSAIKYGLITSPEIATFSKKPISSPCSMTFRNDIKSVLSEPLRMSLPIISFALALKCLEIINSSPPHLVIESNMSIIKEVKLIDSNKLMQILLSPPGFCRRCDLSYLLDYLNEDEKFDENEKLVLQLYETQSSICRWRKKKRFAWFTIFFVQNEDNDIIKGKKCPLENDDNSLTDLSDSSQNSNNTTEKENTKKESFRFPTSDGNFIILSFNELKLPNDRTFSTNSIYIGKKKGGLMRKSIDIITVEQMKRSRSNLFPINGSNPYLQHLEFASANVASSFESELSKIQKEIINKMIEKLET
ncbi:hypothetical protein M9Y10_013136 [Tritrichomonas musculus]|uniref:FPL domain-containing protein n=1 Tax=Tritrichomonas musculus TaxID=1915356 RepID=A0ABR2I6J6_9EUKA